MAQVEDAAARDVGRRHPHALAVVGATSCFLASAARLLGPTAPGERAAASLVMLAETSVIAVVTTAIRDRMWRREVARRAELDRAYRAKSDGEAQLRAVFASTRTR